MAQILLISDTLRVTQVFQALEHQESLQLRTAASLNQADQEISASAPDYTFVQSRISGFSGGIILRHLKKSLPADARIYLLADSAEEMEQAYQQGDPYLDLSVSDEALTGCIKEVLAGVYQSPQPVLAAPPAPEPVAGQGEAALGPVAEEPAATQPKAPQQAGAPQELEQPQPVEPPAELPGSRQARVASFAQMMDRAAGKEEAPGAAPYEVDDRITLGKAFAEAAETAGRPGRSESVTRGKLVSAGELIHGESLADAMRRAKKKKRPLWVPILALALICVPLAAYLAGRKAAPPESALAPRAASQPARKAAPKAPAPAPGKVPVAVAPATQPAAPKATAQPAAPAAAQGAKPEAKPAASPAVQAGQKSLPALIPQTKPDPEYGKSHPGWQRYLGANFEYKVFREGGLYKALQVLPLHGDAIPDQLFITALREFGGGEGYRVESTGEKGKYLVEQGNTKGGVALTVYRHKSDRRMKAFVLYYR